LRWSRPFAELITMRRPPPLASLSQYPVTGGIGLLAIAVTLVWWSGRDIEPLTMSLHAWRGQLWRLVSSALPHLDLIHLAFNLYWLWVFGTLIEEVYGHIRTAALMLFLAAVSSAAEYAFFQGGVGLSGVGYGLFGMLWVLSRKDPRFVGAVDANTAWLFVGWFFLCIALTVADVWSVGNVAHGAGAAFGFLLGWCVVARRWRPVVAGVVGLLVVVIWLAASVGRPYVNLSRHLGAELAYLGYQDLEAGHNERALELYRQAVEQDDQQADWWFNLGVACQRLQRDEEASDAYQRAYDLKPRKVEFRQHLVEWKTHHADLNLQLGNDEKAVELYRDVLAIDEQNAQIWYGLGCAYQRLGNNKSAMQAYKRATNLKPNNPGYRAALDSLRLLGASQKK
jgi:membrane associated rhomboid family serine protease/Tfp pilus assembly protein PilF